MTDYKIYFGYTAAILTVISYAPYLLHVYQGKTKPHAFTWLIWGVLTGIGFFAQISAGGGAGAWATGVACVFNFILAGVGFYQRWVTFVRFDWLSLTGAFLAGLAWYLTSNPLLAVILISISDITGFLPTLRKGYYYPDYETVSGFALGTFAFVAAIFALDEFTLTTWLYPAVISVCNVIFVVMILVRRRQLGKSKTA